MSLFPECPVSLGDLILANCESGRLDHLSLTPCSGDREGKWQASFRKRGTNGYKVYIAPTAEEALLRVLGPDYGHDWAEILGFKNEPGAALQRLVDDANDDDEEDLGDLV